MNSKISIVMSTYNETKEELKQAIESILNQTLKEFEFIIILDNPNNEEHIKVIKEYEKQDCRIKFLINKKNIGLAKSLNKGIKCANSKYIARMDADDISFPERLEKQYIFLEENEDIDILSTNKINIDENNIEINRDNDLPTQDKDIKKVLKYMSIVVHPSVMFRKDRIEQIGAYREFPASQDYDLWLRACTENLKFSIINEYLIKYRIRNNNISNKNPLKQWILHEYILKLYKQRMKHGTDKFSIESLNKNLNKNKAFDEKQIVKFKKGMDYMNKFKKSIKEKKILLSIGNFFKTIICHKKMGCVMYNYIMSYIIKRGE